MSFDWIGAIFKYLFQRDGQRADFESVYDRMQKIAERQDSELAAERARCDELEKRCDEMRTTMNSKLDELWQKYDQCHAERRQLEQDLNRLTIKVQQMESQLDTYQSRDRPTES